MPTTAVKRLSDNATTIPTPLQRSFEQLVLPGVPLARRILASSGSEDPDAALQAALLHAWQAFPRMVAITERTGRQHSWRSWLAAIARRVALDEARRRAVLRRVVGRRVEPASGVAGWGVEPEPAGAATLEGLDALPGVIAGTEPEQGAEGSALLAVVAAALAGCSPVQQRAVASWLAGRSERAWAAREGLRRLQARRERVAALAVVRAALVAGGWHS